MDGAAIFRRVAATANKALLPVLNTSAGQRVLGSSTAVVSYTGRRSGKQVTLPVNYRRDKNSGDIVIAVLAPDAKKWWRNFTGDGAPLRIQLGSTTHDAHGVASRNDKGAVRVRVALHGLRA